MNNIVYVVIDGEGYIVGVYDTEQKAIDRVEFKQRVARDFRILEFEVE